MDWSPRIVEPVRGSAGLKLLGGVLVLAASILLTWRWAGLGDYPNDAGPALAALAGGHIRSFFHVRSPAMGPLSLYLRAPFVALAGGNAVAAYRYGCVPCVAIAGFVGLWLADVSRARGATPLGATLIAVLAIFNPLVRNALALGHPEEVLGAALCAAALVATIRGQDLAGALLLGLAIACKQWALVAVGPVLLASETPRLRTLALAAAPTILLALPQLVGGIHGLLHEELFLSHGGEGVPSMWSWFYPLAPSVSTRLPALGPYATFSTARIPSGLGDALRPGIVLLAVGLSYAAWRRRSAGRLELERVCALAALLFLLRATLDSEAMPYYFAALMTTVLAWDTVRPSGHSMRSVAVALASYVLVDRVPLLLAVGPTSWLLALSTAGVAGWLALAVWKRSPLPPVAYSRLRLVRG